MFRITMGKGFQLTFPNGVVLSTQFGYGNYCDNLLNNSAICYGLGLDSQYSGPVKSNDAEIAIFDKDGAWITRQMYLEIFGEDLGDDVLGYVEMEGWLKILNWCQSYQNNHER